MMRTIMAQGVLVNEIGIMLKEVTGVPMGEIEIMPKEETPMFQFIQVSKHLVQCYLNPFFPSSLMINQLSNQETSYK